MRLPRWARIPSFCPVWTTRAEGLTCCALCAVRCAALRLVGRVRYWWGDERVGVFGCRASASVGGVMISRRWPLGSGK